MTLILCATILWCILCLIVLCAVLVSARNDVDTSKWGDADEP
jgi:hypothetical protein